MNKTLYFTGLLTLSTGLFASAQTSLYTTTDDFGLFNGGTNVTSSTYYSIASTVNGVGNTSNPGGTGGVGSLQLTSTNQYNFVAEGGFPGPTAAAFAAFSPGSTRPYSPEAGYGAGNMVANSGTFTFDVYTGNLVGYSYYSFGIGLNYDGHFNFFFPTTSTSTFTGADGNTWTHYVVPYTTGATALNFFGWGIVENSGGGPGGETIYVDNIQVLANPVPEPGTMALAAMGGVALLFWHRRRSAC